MNSSTVYMQHPVLQKQAHGDLASPGEGKTPPVTRETASQGLQEQNKGFLDGKTKVRSHSCHLWQGRCRPDRSLLDLWGTPRPHRTAQDTEGCSTLLPAGS